MTTAAQAQALVDQSERAKAAWALVGELFDAEIDAAQGRLSEVVAAEPWAAEKIRALAGAVNVARAVKSRMVVLANAEGGAREQLKHLRKIEAMSLERRRILGI